jgi:hypothetical protein
MTSAPPRVDSYLYYEMYGKEHLQPRDAARFDYCTLVYSVCETLSFIQQILNEASEIGIVGEIIILVQPCADAPKVGDKIQILRAPNVRVEMLDTYDINARFSFTDLKYASVLHVEEDSSHLPTGIVQAFQFFRLGYFDRIVGTTDLAGFVGYDDELSAWTYKSDKGFKRVRDSAGTGWSVANVHGMLVPTDLQMAYLKPKYMCLREYVYQKKECAGLLMNVIAYMETKKTPLWIEGSSTYPKEGKRTTHTKTACLAEFASTFDLELELSDLPFACMIFSEDDAKRGHRESLNVTVKNGVVIHGYTGRPPSPYPYMYSPRGEHWIHRIDSLCGAKRVAPCGHEGGTCGSPKSNKQFLTYIPVLGHSNQLQAVKHAVQIAKLLGVTLLIPRFYSFSRRNV